MLSLSGVAVQQKTVGIHSILVVTPVIYTNILAGIKNLDLKMKDMARVFGINGLRRLLYVYLPELKTYIIAAFALATGMAFKAGIAAEVIGTPGGSVGKCFITPRCILRRRSYSHGHWLS